MLTKNLINKVIANQRNSYKIVYELGQGSAAKVYSAMNLKNKQHYAVKVISNKNTALQESIKNEIAIQQKFNSPNIIKYYDTIFQGDNLFLIMEQGQQSLRNYLQTLPNKVLNEQQLISMLYCVTDALKEIHDKQIIHRDIKIQNIILVDEIYKITDFGISAVDDLRSTFVGTKIYLAPEIIKSIEYDNSYDKLVDIWSLGVLIFQAYFGTNPFYYENNLLQSIGDFNKFLQNIQQITIPRFNIDIVIKKLEKDKKFEEANLIKKKILQTQPKIMYMLQRIFQYNPKKRANINQVQQLLINIVPSEINPGNKNKNLNKKKKKINTTKNDLPQELYFIFMTRQQIKDLFMICTQKNACIQNLDFLMYALEEQKFECKFQIIKYNSQKFLQNRLKQLSDKKNRSQYLRHSFFKIFYQIIKIYKNIHKNHLFRILVCCIFEQIREQFNEFKKRLSQIHIQVNNFRQLFQFSQKCSIQNVKNLENIVYDHYFI